VKRLFGLVTFLIVVNLVPRLEATSICDVQAFDAQGLSPLNGKVVTVTGVVTVPPEIFVPQYTSIYIRGVGDDDCGINVFGFDRIPGLALGDTIRVRGTVEEYIANFGATTEIVFSAISDVTLIGGGPEPEPVEMPTGEVGSEANEGKLVRVEGRVVAKESTREITVDDGSGPIIIRDQGGTFSADPTWQDLFPGDMVTVTGIVAQSDPSAPYLSDYKIWPRSPEFGDVAVPVCTPDTTVKHALVEVVDENGQQVSIFCPECGEKVYVRFAGPHLGRASVRIYDGYGRLVATLEDHITRCGRSEIEWEGRNELLERLPVGLYHVVVTAQDPITGETTTETVPIVIGRRLK